jgi:hypothetical protein
MYYVLQKTTKMLHERLSCCNLRWGCCLWDKGIIVERGLPSLRWCHPVKGKGIMLKARMLSWAWRCCVKSKGEVEGIVVKAEVSSGVWSFCLEVGGAMLKRGPSCMKWCPLVQGIAVVFKVRVSPWVWGRHVRGGVIRVEATRLQLLELGGLMSRAKGRV